MKRRTGISNQNVLLGCGFLSVLVVLGLAGMMYLMVQREFNRGQYPGAKEIPNQNYYRVNPLRPYVRMENAYRTQHELIDIYTWYEDQFGFYNFDRVYDPGGDCLEMRNSVKSLMVQRTTGVLICETERGQMIWMTRIISRN